MKIIESLAALGMWAALGIAADGMETTQTIWPGWSQEAEWIETEEQTEVNEAYDSWWKNNTENTKTENGQSEEKQDTEVTGQEYDSSTVERESEEYSTENGTGGETEQERQTEKGSDRDSDSETEEKKIWLSDIHVSETSRYYDGTRDVKVEANVTGLPEGMRLTITGKAEQKDVGVWKVETQAVLEGTGSENYTIEEKRQEPLTVTILPRPLQITISNAHKPYYSENRLSELIFEQDEYLEISGFVEEECKDGSVPEGFQFPELEIDENVLQKSSPMYRNGELICYRNAIVLKKEKDGTISGNPTANYTFNMEENQNITGGNVVLSATPIIGTLDYTVQCSDEKAISQDREGKMWIRKGETLSVVPTPGRGFTDGERIGQIYGNGTAEFALTARDSDGGILAQSQIRSLTWHTDAFAPEAGWAMDGKEIQNDKTYYCKGETSVSCIHISDRESGIRKVEMYVAYEEERNMTGEELYGRCSELWQERSELPVGREGISRVWCRLEDQVGNVRYQCTGEIVTDFTAPEIKFENIVSGSANSHDVEPICMFRDENLNEKEIHLTLTGFHNGVREVQWERTVSEKDGSIQMKMKNIPEKKSWDDVYTLRAEGKDLAGNSISREIRFSVNRFGSVYYLDEKTRERTSRYYLPNSAEVKIYEVNVDHLTESEIMLGYEGETRQLAKDRDYTVKKSGDDQSWKEYCYTISAGCFEEEGMYYVICASQDRAENTSDNRMRKQKIEFAVDRSGPEILLGGIEKDGIYRETEKQVHLECRDNLALQEVAVWVNGEEISRNEKQDQKITLEKAGKWQTIRVVAQDKAGNKTDTGEQYFWLNDEMEAASLTDVKQSDRRKVTEYLSEMEDADPTETTGVKAEVPVGIQREKTAGKNRKIVAGIAVITALWAIFLKLKRHN